MSQGRSLRLFLVDGTPNGLLTAEIMNWTGHVLTGPRSKLAELVQRPECARTGVYFRTAWVVEGSGQTYAAWQEQQLADMERVDERIAEV